MEKESEFRTIVLTVGLNPFPHSEFEFVTLRTDMASWAPWLTSPFLIKSTISLP